MRTLQRNAKAAQRAGFSLAELMVVIVIIGLLGTVVVPNVLDRLSRSQVSTTAASITQIYNAAELYYMDNQAWPDSLEQLVTKDESNASYLKGKVPTDAWGNEFVLDFDGTDFLVWSLGRDGSQGGEGDDKDFNNVMILNKEVK